MPRSRQRFSKRMLKSWRNVEASEIGQISHDVDALGLRRFAPDISRYDDRYSMQVRPDGGSTIEISELEHATSAPDRDVDIMPLT